MGSKVRSAIVFVVALVVVLGAAGMRLQVVGSLDRRFAAERKRALERVLAEYDAIRLGQALPPTAPAEITQQAEKRVSAQFATSSANSAWTLVCSAVMMLGCLAVAWATGSKAVTAFFAFLAWVANGAVTGLLMYSSIVMMRQAQAMIPRPVGMPAPPMPPFHLLLVAGLGAAILWHGPLPAVIGWVVGSNVHRWRGELRQLEGMPPLVLEQPLSPGATRCSCGAVNLATAQECYACGNVLEGDDVSSA